MAHPLDGIRERFKRADEHIDNFKTELTRFFEKKGHRTVIEQNTEQAKEFRDFWANQSIPPRFGVLVSEVLHHYRAALDNLYWQLVAHGSGIPTDGSEERLQFPISKSGPLAPHEITAFQGKIQGVMHGSETIIHGLQPYQCIPKPNGFLRILHDMNRFDKHRELAIIDVPIHERPEFLVMDVETISKNGTVLPSISNAEVHVGTKLTALIAFREFGIKGYPRAALPGLRDIGGAVKEAVRRFDQFFPK